MSNKRSIEERIRDSGYWKSGEPFTAHEVAINIKAKRNSVVSALRRMGDDVVEHPPRGSVPMYGRRNKGGSVLHKRMVSGELSYKGCGPLEWSRRYR